MQNNPQAYTNLILLIVLGLFLLVYFLPVLIAMGRQHPQTGAIFLLNLLLGLTFLGWVAALVWACTTWQQPLCAAPPAPAPVPQERSPQWHWGMDLRPARQYPFHTPHPRDVAQAQATSPCRCRVCSSIDLREGITV